MREFNSLVTIIGIYQTLASFEEFNFLGHAEPQIALNIGKRGY